MSEIEITTEGYDELIRKLDIRIDTRACLAAGAGTYKAAWRAHFKTLDAAGNRKGYHSQHFWIEEGVKKTDIAALDAASARVVCDSRQVAFRATGGTIRPREAGALAIPMSPEAYKAGWPSNSGLPLEFIPIKNGRNPSVRGKLVEAAATRLVYQKGGGIKKGRGNTKTVGRIHYLLVSKVEQVGMGDAVKPAEPAASDAVAARMAEAVRLQVERAQGK
jgi:hypothetical protein